MKQLQHTHKTPETYTCNMHVMQHPDILLHHPDETPETFACNMNIRLQHAYIDIATYATSK
jgi:hypothetical protein